MNKVRSSMKKKKNKPLKKANNSRVEEYKN